jgi:hypothetical protein
VRLRRGAKHLWVTCALALAFAALAFAATGATASTTNVVPLPLCCIPSGPVNAIAVDGNTAYVGGAFTHLGLPRHHLALLDPSTGQPQDGTPRVEGTFASPAVPDNGFISASVPDGSGGWYVAGSFTSIGGVPRAGLAHLLADKSVDPNWAPTTDGTVKAIARAGSTVYVGGSFAQVNGSVARKNLAAFDANGQPTSFAPDPDDQVNVLATSFRIQVSGVTTTTFARLYVGGAFQHLGLTSWHYFAVFDTANGSRVGTDQGLDGPVTTMAVGPGTSGASSQAAVVYVGGAFTHTTSQARNHMAKFSEDGVVDTMFDAPVNFAPTGLGVTRTQTSPTTSVVSSVYIGGVTQEHGHTVTGLAAVDPVYGNDISAFSPVFTSTSPPGQPAVIRSIVVSGGTIYIGGRFLTVNGALRNNLAALDASSGATLDWDPDASGLNTGVTNLAFDGNSMLTSGEFEQIGGPARSNLAAIDMTTGQVLPFNPGTDGQVDALAVQGSTLYVGGEFGQVGGNVHNGLAAVDTGSGALTGFDAHLQLFDTVKTLAPAGGTIFIGGDFSQIQGQPRMQLGEVDAQTGAVTPFRADLDGTAVALLHRGNTLYLAGQFNHVGGVARTGFASIDGNQVSTFDPQPDGFSSSLLIHGNTLYVGGNFQHVLNGVPRAHMAAFDLGNLALLPFDPGLDAEADSLADDDSELFVMGQGLGMVSGAARPGIGAIDFSSGLGNAWAPAFLPNSQLNSIALSRTAGLAIAGELQFNGGGVFSLYAIAPSTPDAPQASSDAPDQATVSFGAPATGGSPVTQYTVTADPGGQTATGSGSPIVVGGLTPGTAYRFTVAAANAAGQGPASAESSAVTVAGPLGPGTGSGVVTKLTASAFKLTHRRFAVGKAKTALSAKKTPIGTVFTFKLSAAATTRITIAQELRGVKKGKRCVAPRKGLRKRCNRLKQIRPPLTRKHTKAGSNRVPFSGRLGKRALKPGTYKATLVATDAAGRRSKPVSATFVVVKAPKKR